MLTRWAALAAAIALLVALGSYRYLSQRSPLVVIAQRVHDTNPGMPRPRLVLAVIFANRSENAIAITGELTLRVRSVNTGGEQRVRPDRQSAEDVQVPAVGSVELIYDLWQLANLYDQGLFKELRDSPEDMRFQLEIETNIGPSRSDEWAGMTAGSDVGRLLRDLRGGDGI